MFIVLRGQVSVYHDDGASVPGDGSNEDEDTAVATSNVAMKTCNVLRQQLGAFIVTLKGK